MYVCIYIYVYVHPSIHIAANPIKFTLERTRSSDHTCFVIQMVHNDIYVYV